MKSRLASLITAALGALLISGALAVAGAESGMPRVGPEDPGVGQPGLPGHVALSGSLVSWGDNEFGQTNIAVPNGEFKAVSAGGYHTLAIRPGGVIAAWGDNRVGQCNVPVPNADFVAVAAGGLHSLGLRANGSVVAWGRNQCGQCNVPAPNTGFVAIAAGSTHNLGLKADGTIVAWGDNDLGQCNVPAPNAGFVAVAAGYEHSLGLKLDGRIVAWGRNDWSQCNVPEPNTGFVAMAGGYWHSIGLHANGTVVTWGTGTAGEGAAPEPNEGFVAVSAGLYHNLAMRADGSIVAWGSNDHGELVLYMPNTGFALISGGFQHNVALKPSGCIPIPMALHLSPKDLNLRAGNGWITGVLEPRPPFSPEAIDVASIALNRNVHADVAGSSPVGDFDRDGIPDLLVRFARSDVVAALEPGDEVHVVVTGALGNNGCFEATDFLTMKGTARPTPGPEVGSVTPVFALRGALSNPGRELSVSFSLPDARPARLVAFDVSGRTVAAREVGALGAGSHVVSLAPAGTLRPGVYLVHLVRGEQRQTARAIVIR